MEYSKRVIVGVILWGATFVVIRLILRKRSFEFCNRVVSTIHAVLAVVMACASVQDWSCPICPLASKPSPSQAKSIAMSMSYLIYDLICCYFEKRFALDNAIHHFVSIFGAAACFSYQKGASEMVAAQCITEVSSPFLHLRFFLKELGYKDTNLTFAADISFAVIFSFARMVGGPYLAYLTLTASNPLFIKVLAMGLQLISAFWFYKIVRMVNYKLSSKSKPRKN